MQKLFYGWPEALKLRRREISPALLSREGETAIDAKSHMTKPV